MTEEDIQKLEKLNPEVKRLWVEALRSGEYKQGQDRLQGVMNNGETLYCCLGVLCELALQQPELELTFEDALRDYSDESFLVTKRCYGSNKEEAVLPDTVMDWAGITSDDPYLIYADSPELASSLNDGGRSFEVIADLIEEQL